MKTLIALFILLSVQAQASAYREDLNAPEALALFRQSLGQLKTDIQNLLEKSRTEIPKIKSSTAAKACLQSNNAKACEQAIRALAPYSVVPLRDKFIFQLGEDLKTKHRFDINTGMKVFQLNTALRWLAKPEIYNGTPMPKVFNKTTFKSFASGIEAFLTQKNIDLQKALPMIR